MSRKMINEVCVICGDKAVGRNFGAITCESCKVFFRRYGDLKKCFKCYFDSNCHMSASSRKFCQKCRLNKCISVGMIKKTREERKLCQNHTKEISNEVSVIHIPDSTADLDATKRLQIENYIKDQAEYGPTYGMPFTPILSDITLRYNFNDMEYKRFNELLMAADVMKAVAREPTARIESVGEAQAVMRSVLERDIRNVIKFTKSLHGFGSLCDGDQICLIKSGCIELIYMRSVLAFNYHNQSWNLFVDDNTSVILELDLLKSGASDIYGAHKKYLQHMGRHWHEDTTIVDLLTAIVLFNPNRPNLEHMENVKLQQRIYMYLLQRYLMVRYGTDSVWLQNKFRQLIAVLDDIYCLGEIQRNIASKRDPQISTPLLREIFNMKPKNCAHF